MTTVIQRYVHQIKPRPLVSVKNSRNIVEVNEKEILYVLMAHSNIHDNNYYPPLHSGKAILITQAFSTTHTFNNPLKFVKNICRIITTNQCEGVLGFETNGI